VIGRLSLVFKKNSNVNCVGNEARDSTPRKKPPFRFLLRPPKLVRAKGVSINNNRKTPPLSAACVVWSLRNRAFTKVFNSFFIFFLFLTISFGKNAFALDLLMPVSCDYGNDCIISNYFDHDKRVGFFTDFSCAKLSTDGHKSTDIRLMNIAQMKDGVNVLAPDSGVVRQVRDGIRDVSVDVAGVESVRGSECGNGVVIEHKRGYKTEYCHLKKDSVAVKADDKVEKGQLIGQVGMSGLSAYPYLQFTVLLNGKPIDPFTGADPVTGNTMIPCESVDIYPLWDKKSEKKLKYISTKLLSSGFSDSVPNMLSARDGKLNKVKAKNDIKLLVYWFEIFGVLAGDELKLSIVAPNGSVLASEVRKIAENKNTLFQFLGQNLEGESWPQGIYKGKIELHRKENDETVTVVNSTSSIELLDVLPAEPSGDPKPK
jgi:hypothetical protein